MDYRLAKNGRRKDGDSRFGSEQIVVQIILSEDEDENDGDVRWIPGPYVVGHWLISQTV